MSETAAQAAIIFDLRRELDTMRARALRAEQDAEAMKWALRGVAALNLTLRVDGYVLKGDELSRVVGLFARRAACELMDEAKLDFRQHAELASLRRERSLRSPAFYTDPTEERVYEKRDWPT